MDLHPDQPLGHAPGLISRSRRTVIHHNAHRLAIQDMGQDIPPSQDVIRIPVGPNRRRQFFILPQ